MNFHDYERFRRNPFVWSPISEVKILPSGERKGPYRQLMEMHLSATIFDKNDNVIEVFDFETDVLYDSIIEMIDAFIKEVKTHLRPGYGVDISFKGSKI